MKLLNIKNLVEIYWYY